MSLSVKPWSVATRIAFRFAFLYLVLFCALTQIFTSLIPIPGFDIPTPAYLPPFRQGITWIATHVFHYTKPLVYVQASGDKVFDWVFVACVLVIAVIGAASWSVLDRRRREYRTLNHWLRVFLRFALAGQMFVYGLVKVFPMQMPFPSLMRLLERFGDFSPMGVLWSSVGASPAYERFAGSAELFAGILLIIPLTSKLGALICLIDMIEVFVLNMTYDVPVKLLSFHLIVISAFLLLPERVRLMQFCLLDRPVEPSRIDKVFTTPRANRISTAVQIALGLLLLTVQLHGIAKGWKENAATPKTELFGIWNIDQMTINGQVHPPLLTDAARYRRIIFDSPQRSALQRMDDTLVYFGSGFDPKTKKLTLTKRGEFTVFRNGKDELVMDGKLDTRAVHMQLSRIDPSQFMLISRGFHWVQEFPFNR
jgi:uncharacterized membrane protein YphA (DoxX/SURF4 family)